MQFRILFASISLGLSAPTVIQAQAERHRGEMALVGTWQLDLARTHYGAGVDRRQRERMHCDIRDPRVTCTVESVRADGRRVTARFSAPYTGAAAAVSGLIDIDTVRLETRAQGVVDATFSYRGRPAFGYRAYRSNDSATLLIVSVDPQTRAALTSVVVYRRVGTPGREMSPDKR
jgi:hypothetical protein